MLTSLLPRGVAATAGSALLEQIGASAVRAASLVRGERVIHAKGTTLSGRLLVSGGAGLGVPLFDDPGRYSAIVRFSRGAGLPSFLPDVLGIAVRILDAHGEGRHQDILVSSAAPPPVLRQLPLPARDLLGALYSSITPYELAGRRYLLGVLPDARCERTTSFDDLRYKADGARLHLAVAAGRGRWHEIALIEIGVPVPNGRQIRFAPQVTGGGIRPAGWLQDLRRRAYPAAHVGPDE